MLGLTRNTKEIELELVYKHSSFKFSLNDASLPIEPVKRKPMRIGIYIRIIASLCSLVFISFRKLIPEVSAVQYTFDRAFCSLILLALYFYFTKQYEIIKKTFEPKIAIISAGGCIADVLYFVAILSLPISEMVTIVSMVAIFNGIIGSYMLGESYLKIEKILGAVSFLGVFLIVRPPFIFGSEGTAEDTPTGSIPRYFAGLIALGCAVVYSLIQVQLREIQARMPPFVVAFYFNLAYVILLGTYYVVTGSHEALNFHELTMIIGSSVFHLANLILLAKSLQLEKPTIVGLVGYTSLVFSPMIDLVVFGSFPSIYTVLGATLIVGSCVKLLLMRS